ncbi:hypothetical protein GCM10008967_19240 [Bacillus carboniphilus]|uniref:Uncharacterized protein n=1 Tax=Bacillus carboniphilus TaxID=86663 RepID=A0ABN0W8H9_9BACI
MYQRQENQDDVRQPLMSTGTTEAGFKKGTEKSKQTTKPKIGNTVVGDDEK